jgi:hypothetical protein
MDVSRSRLFDTREPLAQAALAVRLAAGVTFLGFSLGKFIRHDAERGAFDRYGIPFPDGATYLIGGLELVGGAALVIGLLVRPFAFALACNMVGAISTAGRCICCWRPPCSGACCSCCGQARAQPRSMVAWRHIAGAQNRRPAQTDRPRRSLSQAACHCRSVS